MTDLSESLIKREPVYFNGSPVPDWAEDFIVRKIREQEAQESNDGEPPPIDVRRTAGPSVLWAKFGLVTLTYFLTALPIVGYYIARCPRDKSSKAYANYPEVLLWIIFFVPMTFTVILTQWKAGTYLKVPMLQKLNSLKGKEANVGIFGLYLSFESCSFIASLLTVFNLLDQMTNALFAAKTYASKQCYGYEFIEANWQHVLGKSSFATMGRLLQWGDFADSTVALYAFQLLLQPLVAMYFTMPLRMWVDYTVKQRKQGNSPDGVQGWETYKTLGDNLCDREDKSDHFAAAVLLAEANRWENIVYNDFIFRRCVVEAELKAVKDDPLSAEEALEKLDLVLEVAQTIQGRAVLRYFMKGFVQNAIQINLQVTLLALSKTVLPGQFDKFNAFTILITIIGMFLDLPDMIAVHSFTEMVCREVCDQADTKNLQSLVSSDLAESFNRKVNFIKRRARRLFVYQSLYVVLAGYALLKLFMAVYYCDQGSWNMRGGCVNMTKFHKDNATCSLVISEYRCGPASSERL